MTGEREYPEADVKQMSADVLRWLIEQWYHEGHEPTHEEYRAAILAVEALCPGPSSAQIAERAQRMIKLAKLDAETPGLSDRQLARRYDKDRKNVGQNLLKMVNVYRNDTFYKLVVKSLRDDIEALNTVLSV